MAKNDKKSRAGSKEPTKRSSQHVSEDERVVWEHVARDLDPIKKKKGRVLGIEVAPAEVPRAADKPKAKPTATATPAPRPVPPPVPTKSTPANDYDRATLVRPTSGSAVALRVRSQAE